MQMMHLKRHKFTKVYNLTENIVKQTDVLTHFRLVGFL